MREFGIESLSSSPVSRATRLLDDERAAWRNRPLGEVKYLTLDARYEKMRHGGVVRDAAVLSATGIGPDERHRVVGESVTLSEAERRWRAFLESLVARGLGGVGFVVADDQAGLRAARRAVLGGATWQRCRFHLAKGRACRALSPVIQHDKAKNVIRILRASLVGPSRRESCTPWSSASLSRPRPR